MKNCLGVGEDGSNSEINIAGEHLLKGSVVEHMNVQSECQFLGASQLSRGLICMDTDTWKIQRYTMIQMH